MTEKVHSRGGRPAGAKGSWPLLAAFLLACAAVAIAGFYIYLVRSGGAAEGLLLPGVAALAAMLLIGLLAGRRFNGTNERSLLPQQMADATGDAMVIADDRGRGAPCQHRLCATGCPRRAGPACWHGCSLCRLSRFCRTGLSAGPGGERGRQPVAGCAGAGKFIRARSISRRRALASPVVSRLSSWQAGSTACGGSPTSPPTGRDRKTPLPACNTSSPISITRRPGSSPSCRMAGSTTSTPRWRNGWGLILLRHRTDKMPLTRLVGEEAARHMMSVQGGARCFACGPLHRAIAQGQWPHWLPRSFSAATSTAKASRCRPAPW